MSWLSEMFGGGGTDWAAVAAQNAERERLRLEQEARDAEAAEKAALLARQQALRTSSADAGRQSALGYFSDLGLDATQYAGDIDSLIQQILSTTAEDDPNIGQYMRGIGESVYGQKTDALRSRSGSQLDQIFEPEFERRRIGDTADDDILAQIEAAERGEAESYINNLFKRGVITDVGQQGAVQNLDEQGARVRGILDEIGQSTLAGGRQRLTDIANRGRQTADTLKLGQNFDAGAYGSEANAATSDFFSKLGDSIRGRVTDNLFDTSGLAAIAGAAQGAGNTAFDPRALAGLNVDEPEQDEEDDPRRITF